MHSDKVRTRDGASVLAAALQGQTAASMVTAVSCSGSWGGHGNYPTCTGAQLARSQPQCANYRFLMKPYVWVWHDFFLLIMQMTVSTRVSWWWTLQLYRDSEVKKVVSPWSRPQAFLLYWNYPSIHISDAFFSLFKRRKECWIQMMIIFAPLYSYLRIFFEPHKKEKLLDMKNSMELQVLKYTYSWNRL